MTASLPILLQAAFGFSLGALVGVIICILIDRRYFS